MDLGFFHVILLLTVTLEASAIQIRSCEWSGLVQILARLASKQVLMIKTVSIRSPLRFLRNKLIIELAKAT